ncbi:hypothetical protein SIN8267_02041 [Sinobacterium norvegicum]|uniref:Uncharacterized protein n=2 Tax=Sinobacterium norvegicum TaxID=1641715 RepID=A0ABN8EHN4_9GAMM|nr:hypothetical protein SIN8267_02041 [Sinobacterium norvegicum]
MILCLTLSLSLGSLCGYLYGQQKYLSPDRHLGYWQGTTINRFSQQEVISVLSLHVSKDNIKFSLNNSLPDYPEAGNLTLDSDAEILKLTQNRFDLRLSNREIHGKQGIDRAVGGHFHSLNSLISFQLWAIDDNTLLLSAAHTEEQIPIVLIIRRIH